MATKGQIEMSEENNNENVTEKTEKKTRESKKNSIPNDKVNEMIEGIPQYDKASFLVVGHRQGVRLALPKTNGVGRAYFYGDGDYSLVPTHDAISVFTEEQRKERRLGGIMAEVNFEKGAEAAIEALAALVSVVRNAPAPAPKGVKEPKAPRKSKTANAASVDSAPVDADPAGN